MASVAKFFQKEVFERNDRDCHDLKLPLFMFCEKNRHDKIINEPILESKVNYSKLMTQFKNFHFDLKPVPYKAQFFSDFFQILA